VPEGEGFEERLFAAVSPVLADATTRMAMAEAARAAALPQAAETVARIVIEEARA
jgi:UDP-N-acetylglucosamine--N-acetylmuramyl-(pentapeptide) pyrophosphoryl-undecaprenol N-acetylglucosamine transferase